eukprot:m.111370 g.111370  ORF g.111370 m.111370 type:complete len:673 (+) comp15381_c0_seq2:202-2220(+)
MDDSNIDDDVTLQRILMESVQSNPPRAVVEPDPTGYDEEAALAAAMAASMIGQPQESSTMEASEYSASSNPSDIAMRMALAASQETAPSLVHQPSLPPRPPSPDMAEEAAFRMALEASQADSIDPEPLLVAKDSFFSDSEDDLSPGNDLDVARALAASIAMSRPAPDAASTVPSAAAPAPYRAQLSAPMPASTQTYGAEPALPMASQLVDNNDVTLQLRPTEGGDPFEITIPRRTKVGAVKDLVGQRLGVAPERLQLFGFEVDVDGTDDSRLSGLIRPSTDACPLLLAVSPSEASAMDDDNNDISDDDPFADRSSDDGSDVYGSDYRHGFADSDVPPPSLEAELIARHELDEPHPSVDGFLVPFAPSTGQDFAEAYTRRYGPVPYFHQGSFLSAATAARRNQRSIAVYLHDDRSAGCTHALKLLQNERVCHVLASYFVLWGHDFSRADSRQALFDTTRDHVRLVDGLTGDTPVIAIVAPLGSSFTLSRCLALPSVASAGLLAQELEELGLMYMATSANEPSRSVESLERQSMIQDQNSAYQACLAADKAKLEEQERQEAAIAAEEQRQQEEAAQAAAQAQKLAQLVRDEPPASDKTAFKIRFQFPSSSSDRRFPADVTIGEVVSYVGSLGFNADEYSVVDPVARTELETYGLDSQLSDKGMPRRMKVHVSER